MFWSSAFVVRISHIICVLLLILMDATEGKTNTINVALEYRSSMIRSYITTLAAVAAAAILTMPSTTAFTVVPAIARRTPPRTNIRLASTTATAITPPLAPLTVWGEPYADILAVQQEAKQQAVPEFGPEISATALGLSSHEEQLQYFSNHRLELLRQMQDHACLVFRDFTLMQTPEGLEAFYQALRMKPCLDPLHSVSARPTVSGDTNSPVYEAVNKESRKNFFIGMHNEFVGTRAPKAAAFGCFKAADVGGEFLIADGRRIFRDLPADLLHTLYTRQIRYSVMELPFFGWIDTKVPEFLRPPLLQILQALVSTVINAKVDFSVEMQWGVSDYDHVRMLQARAPPQPPVVRHPITGDPTWFCNVHSHSSFLRQSREALYVRQHTTPAM